MIRIKKLLQLDHKWWVSRAQQECALQNGKVNAKSLIALMDLNTCCQGHFVLWGTSFIFELQVNLRVESLATHQISWYQNFDDTYYQVGHRLELKCFHHSAEWWKWFHIHIKVSYTYKDSILSPECLTFWLIKVLGSSIADPSLIPGN